jgi:tetratricopeptide (TPR) repeat protein
VSARAETLPRSLVATVLVLALAVLGLGGTVLAVKLRPQPTPTTPVDRALAQWEQAVQQNPKSGTAQTGLGLALLDAGDLDGARAHFELAVKLDDRNWMARFQLGVLIRHDQPARAIDLLARASRLAPHTEKAGPLVAEGDLLLTRGDATDAETAYRRAIGDSPFILEAHVGLARALDALGDVKGALQEYHRALQFDPGNPQIEAAIHRLNAGATT